MFLISEPKIGNYPTTRSRTRERDHCTDGPLGGRGRSSSRAASGPPPSPVPTPSPSPPPQHRAIGFEDTKFADIAYYAERSHLSDLSELDNAALLQFREDHLGIDPRTAYDIPGDTVGQRFAILADAARPGHRSGEYVAPVVANVQGYFERGMLPLMDEIENCKEMLALDQAAIAEADHLIADFEDEQI